MEQLAIEIGKLARQYYVDKKLTKAEFLKLIEVLLIGIGLKNQDEVREGLEEIAALAKLNADPGTFVTIRLKVLDLINKL